MNLLQSLLESIIIFEFCLPNDVLQVINLQQKAEISLQTAIQMMLNEILNIQEAMSILGPKSSLSSICYKISLTWKGCFRPFIDVQWK